MANKLFGFGGDDTPEENLEDVLQDQPLEEVLQEAEPTLDVTHFLSGAGARPRGRRLEVSGISSDRVGRWVRNDPALISYREEQGYRIERSPNIIAGDEGQPDAVRRAGNGELVLMSRPIETHMAHLQAMEIKANEALSRPIKGFQRVAAEAGVGTIDRSRITTGDSREILRDAARDARDNDEAGHVIASE